MKQLRPRSLVLLSLAAVAACARHTGDVAQVLPGVEPLFETRTEISTGGGLHSDYRVADFDGNGNVDTAVLNVTGELRVLLGNNGVFTLGQQLQLGGETIWITGGDIDNDGDEDLVVVRRGPDTVDVLLNDGNATFSPAPYGQLPIPFGALAVVVGDFDNDDALDVAVSLPAAPQILIGWGDGSGGFQDTLLITLPGGGSALNLGAGDPTRDGVTDLVLTDPALGRVLIFPGENKSNFGEQIIQLNVPDGPAGVSFGDLSGDGLPDMVLTQFLSTTYRVVTELLGPEGQVGGTVWTYSYFTVEVGAQPALSTVGDVTGDGVPDLVGCLAFDASVFIAPGLQGGGVGGSFQLDCTGEPLRPFVGDIDNSGKADLLVLDGLGDLLSMWLAKDDGALAGARNYDTGLATASWIESGDFDGDGDVEVVTAATADTHLAILGPGGGGTLDMQSSVDVGAGVYQLEAGDLDGDGKPDLVVGVQGGLKVLRNISTPGDYAFELVPLPPLTVGSGDFPFGIALGDFDRDGSLDIAMCDYEGGGLHLVPGTATPFVFAAETVIQLDGGPADVVATDFTGDGLLDLAVSRTGAADITVLRNEGNGVFAAFLTIPVGSFPTYLITSDFDRDGRGDLVVSNSETGTVSVLFGNQTGFTGQSYPAGLTPTALLARDLSGDGYDDILVASLQSGDFRVLVGDGNGGFPLVPRFPGTLGASDAVLQDMDGDGRPDLLITSLITDRVSVVRNITD